MKLKSGIRYPSQLLPSVFYQNFSARPLYKDYESAKTPHQDEVPVDVLKDRGVFFGDVFMPVEYPISTSHRPSNSITVVKVICGEHIGYLRLYETFDHFKELVDE